MSVVRRPPPPPPGPVGSPPAPPADVLVATFRCLDDVLARAVELPGDDPAAQTAHPYRGLYLSPGDADRSLADDPGAPRYAPDADEDPVAGLAHLGAATRLGQLAAAYGLGPFDLAGLVIALAPEFDLKYERLFGYLQDDVSRRRPSVDLVLDLLCRTAGEKLERRAHFAPDSPLLRNRVVRLAADHHSAAPLLSWSVRPDEQVARFVLHQRGLDPRLAPFCRLSRPDAAAGGPHGSVTDREFRTLAGAVVRARKEKRPLRFYFHGRVGSGQPGVAAALAAEATAPLLAADLNRWPALAGPDADELPRVLVREAVFQGAVLYLESWEAIQDAAAWRPALRDALTAELSDFTGVAVLAGEAMWVPTPRGPRGVVTVGFDVPPFDARRECWRARADAAGLPLPADQLDALAGLYRMTATQIADAVATVAATHPAVDRYSDPAAIDPEAFTRAARAQSGHELARLARRVHPAHGWDDLVLAPDVKAQLRELCVQIRYKRRVREQWGFGQKLARNAGTSALFSGASGTGKTTSASIIARELHLDLYEIDLSRVVSKYIGETEQNLRRIFDAAVNSNAIIQFNECDALWGKRSEVKDAHDRYANIEIAFLLQEMEQFDGVVVLTTNLRQNLDEAFTRRLDFLVDFPFPDEAARRRIWEVLLPADAPREHLDLDVLARLRLSGGNIKNVIYAGAFYAVEEDRKIRTTDLVRAVRREHQKMGRMLNESELGPYGKAPN